MILGSNGVDCVRWLRKIPTQLRGMNFCTNSARFTPSFVTQPNGHNAPKLYEMHQNMSLKSNRIYRVRSFRKISMRLRATNFCTSSVRFAPSFVSQPNGPKCTKIVQNAPKHEFRFQRGWIRCIGCEKLRRDFVARTFAPVRPVLHRVS